MLKEIKNHTHSSPLPAFLNPSNSNKPPTQRKEAGRDKSEFGVGWGVTPPCSPSTPFLSQAEESFWRYDVIRCQAFDKWVQRAAEPLISHLQASGRHPRWSWECILAPSQIHIFSCFFFKAYMCLWRFMSSNIFSFSDISLFPYSILFFFFFLRKRKYSIPRFLVSG